MSVSWRRSGYDDQMHAFPAEQVPERGRRYVALCSHSVPPASLEPAGHRGHWSALLDPSACLPCLVAVSDQLADARADRAP